MSPRPRKPGRKDLIAFDEMSEDEFQQLVRAIFALIARRYWPQLDASGVEELVRMEMGR